MPLPAPRLDDRTFADMVAEAMAIVDRTCPQWTDRGAGDPGVTLVELYAFLTENLLYRLNRAPDKLQVNLMNLLGVRRRPPSAAAATLTFTRTTAVGELEIPTGSQVATADGSTVFVLTRSARLPRDAPSVEAPPLRYQARTSRPRAGAAPRAPEPNWIRPSARSTT